MQTTIVLIDDKQLAELMQAYGVGVSVEDTIRTQKAAGSYGTRSGGDGQRFDPVLQASSASPRVHLPFSEGLFDPGAGAPTDRSDAAVQLGGGGAAVWRAATFAN